MHSQDGVLSTCGPDKTSPGKLGIQICETHAVPLETLHRAPYKAVQCTPFFPYYGSTASAVTTHSDDEHVIGQLEAVGLSERIASRDLLVDGVDLAAHSLVVAALK